VKACPVIVQRISPANPVGLRVSCTTSTLPVWRTLSSTASPVPGDDCARIEQSDLGGVGSGRFQAALDHCPQLTTVSPSPSSSRQLGQRASSNHRRGRAAAFRGVQQGAVLKEEGRIIPAQRRAQQPYGVSALLGKAMRQPNICA